MKVNRFYQKGRKKLFALIILLLILQSAGTLLIPFLVARLIDTGIMKADMQAIINTGIQMLLVSLLTTLVSIGGSYYSAEFAASFGRDLRDVLFRKTQDLSLSDFEAFGTSSILTRTTTDISVIQKATITVLQLVIPTPIILITAITLTLQESRLLALIITGFILVFLIAAGIILAKAGSLAQYIQVRMDKINRILRESIIGVRVIRAFNQSGSEKERCNECCDIVQL